MIKLNILKKRAKFLGAFLINTIFPIECVSCGKEDVWICNDCLLKIKLNTDFFCASCSSKNNYGAYCNKCKNKFFLKGVWIAGNYNVKGTNKKSSIAVLINRLKYNFAKKISEHLGDFLFRFLKNIFKQAALSSFLSGKEYMPNTLKQENRLPQIMTTPSYNTIIIPVPLHIKKLKWRGFNQAELIAQVVSSNADIKINCHDLIKIKHNGPQTKLKADKRRKNVHGAYRWVGKKIKNKNIILIDDVITTGATLNECAKILKKNGANEIWGLVLAKN
jgi:ComF family protein